MSRMASQGDKVKVHYTGSLNDGTVFDSSREREPLAFQLGEGQLIPGFERAVLGMAIGESKEIKIPPHEAYGEHSKDLVRPVEKKYLPKDMEPQVGMQLQLGSNEDLTIVTIVGVDGEKVLLDANHPLAGKTLVFNIELVDII